MTNHSNSLVRSWQTWRAPFTAADALLTDYRPAELWVPSTQKLATALQGKVINVYPWPLIDVMVLGQAANNVATVARITGFMGVTDKAGPGPGVNLTQMNITLGNFVWGTPDFPLAKDNWTSAAWRFPDTFDTATTNWDLTGGIVKYAFADKPSFFRLPTLGFCNLLIEFPITFNWTAAGVLWRGVSPET